jgi:hypothetical protein
MLDDKKLMKKTPADPQGKSLCRAPAILALEKGTPGERAFAEVFQAWKQ